MLVFLFFWPQDMWDLTSQTRVRTCTPLEGEVLIIGPPGRSQGINFRLDVQRSFCGYTISAEPAKWIMQSQPPREKQGTNKGLQHIQLFRCLIAREKNKVLIAQSGTTLCNPMDCSPPGSSVHGILQARILEWVAISFSRGASQPRD